MGLGVGILLLAVGAVLAFAVHVNPTNGAIDLHTVGWILMIVGPWQSCSRWCSGRRGLVPVASRNAET
jgi:hypothetical protein